MNPVKKLHDFGQSPWMDYIHRRSLEQGELERQVREDGISGVTSNPSIFQKAIGSGTAYDDALRRLSCENPRASGMWLFEQLAVADIQAAADVLRPVYDETEGRDGFVSLEVSPYRAYDTAGTIRQAERLFETADRPNVMIKVPATSAGIPAIEELIARGLNVNITLMFSLDHYEAVAEAYIRGLERLEVPERLGRIASVASFFVSRVDAKVDPLLERQGSEEAKALSGKIAIANSKLAYRRFREIFHGERFAALAEQGARVQRVLWASTSTKNPDYPDVLYVDELVGAETINTMPPETIEAYRDHGDPDERLTEGVEEAERQVESLARLGIDLDRVTEALQREGVEKFAQSFDELLATVEDQRRRHVAAAARGGQRISVGEAIGAVSDRLLRFQDECFAERLATHDRTLWSDEPEEEILDRLGWLHLPWSMADELDEILGLAEEVQEEGYRHAVVLGMGGSSLAPEVFARTFGPRDGWPVLEVLDSTHPDAVAALAERLDLAKTIFVVSSKSGTTVETLSFFHAFWSRVEEAVGEPGEHFVAVTDPGTPLEELGREKRFRAVFRATPEVGGRYSALTHFGLVPAALAGYDVEGILDRALGLAEASSLDPEMVHEPLRLGAALGELANAGRDKLTFFTSRGLAAFPDWIEQLVAESTGKEGTGLVPVIEQVPGGELERYGDDRIFVGIVLDGDDGADEIAKALSALEEAGHPTVLLTLRDPLDLGREMFRWELAVATAGAVLGIHPFDQPDVQLAKDLAKQAIGEGLDGGGERLSVADREALSAALSSWLDGTVPGDYLGIHAYVAPDDRTSDRLEALRCRVAETTGRPVTLGYGPRFLHSTGQLHKGGPDTGRFLQLVDHARHDLPVPESDHSFGTLLAGQAAGDRQALAQRGRQVLTVDLGDDPAAGLEALGEILGG